VAEINNKRILSSQIKKRISHEWGQSLEMSIFDGKIHDLRLFFAKLLFTPFSYFIRVDFTSFFSRFSVDFVIYATNTIIKILFKNTLIHEWGQSLEMSIFDGKIHDLRLFFAKLLFTPFSYFIRVDFTSFFSRFSVDFVIYATNTIIKILLSKDRPHLRQHRDERARHDQRHRHRCREIITKGQIQASQNNGIPTPGMPFLITRGSGKHPSSLNVVPELRLYPKC
jgi:hypothetical protein